jgi:hypothetical protein
MRGGEGLCYHCVHWKDNNDADEPMCAAFPDGIPTQILNGRMDHRRPVHGDNGIVFEARANTHPEFMARFEAELNS